MKDNKETKNEQQARMTLVCDEMIVGLLTDVIKLEQRCDELERQCGLLMITNTNLMRAVERLQED